jgi:hypothetical protein
MSAAGSRRLGAVVLGHVGYVGWAALELCRERER